MRLYAAYVRVRRALFATPSIDGTRTYIWYMYTQCMHVAVSMCLATRTNGSPMRARRTRARTCCVRVRAHVCVCDLGLTHPRGHMRARAFSVDRGWLGAQAFHSAKVFNANIGAWNTARVTTLNQVCAASSARRRATAGGTRSAGVRCGAGRCARRRRRCARACVCADVWARACAGVHV